MRYSILTAFLLLNLSSTLVAQRGDADFLAILHKNELRYLGKSSAEVETLLGKPIRTEGTTTHGAWYYRFGLKPADATRVIGFTVFFKDNHVISIFPRETVIPFFEIGTFPGFVGAKATQVSVMENFRTSRNPEKLSPNERVLFVERLLGRIDVARSKNESLQISTKSLFFRILKSILAAGHINNRDMMNTKADRFDLGTIEKDLLKFVGD